MARWLCFVVAWLLLVGCSDQASAPPVFQSADPNPPLELGLRPHVTLLSVPGLTQADLSAYGGPDRPALDRLLAEGVRFDNCMAAVAEVDATLASLERGAWPVAPGVALPAGLFAELEDAGYRRSEASSAEAFLDEVSGAATPLAWSPGGSSADAVEAQLADWFAASPEAEQHLLVLVGSGRFDTQTLSDTNLRVPLILHWPGQLGANQARPQVVAHPDVVPTILELVGAARGEAAPPWGRSFARLATQRLQTWRETHYSMSSAGDSANAPSAFRLRATAWSYTWTRSSGEQLYDLRSDRSESTNIAGQPGAAEIQGILRQELTGWVQASGYELN